MSKDPLTEPFSDNSFALQETFKAFLPILGNSDDYLWLLKERPKLAHYTSIQTLESILKGGEIWFSNPLFMNDLEEMRFGMQAGAKLFATSPEIDAICETADRAKIARDFFQFFFTKFDTEHAIDVFVFCLSEHDPAEVDGTLSMWRGYGRGGNGAALVFNTDFAVEGEEGLLIIARVQYGSTDDRQAYLRKGLEQWVRIFQSRPMPDEVLAPACRIFFEYCKIAALTWKHRGFREEKEWRIIYLPDRDMNSILSDRIGYVIGPRGVEPKLKLPTKPLPSEVDAKWTFDSILHQIILGPTVSSPLAKSSILRMLQHNNKSELKEKVTTSTIPLRPEL